MIDSSPIRPPVALAVAVTLATALGLAGCGGGGGGGGSASGASSASSGWTGIDSDAPEITITRPARGEYFSANPTVTVEGNASDATSGVATVEVNGRFVTPDPQGNFSLPLTLADGVNIITARATDRAQNNHGAAISVMYCPRYRLATEDISDAAALRFNESAVNAVSPVIGSAIAASGVIQQKLTASPVYRGDVRDPIFNTCIASAEARVLAIAFDPPWLVFDAVTGGFNALIHIPNLRVDMNVRSYCGIGYSATGYLTSSDATLDVGLTMALANGQYIATVNRSNVALDNFRWAINGIPAVITNIVYSEVKNEVEMRLAGAVRQELPVEIVAALQLISQPISRTFGSRTVTFRAEPQALLFDDDGFDIDFVSNVTAARDPAVALVPGSFYIAGSGRPPAFGTALGFYGSLNENLLNRALFTSWQAGFWNFVIDSQFLNQFGVTLPFQLDGQLLAAFFPQIQGMITPGSRVPLGIKVEPLMQPVVRMTGSPNLADVAIGELHLALLLDFGAGFQPLFEVSLHVRGGFSATFQNNTVVFSISPNVQFETDLLSQAMPLNGIDLERFLSFLVPSALQVATQSMTPIPLPAPAGLTLDNISIYRDGASGEFCTLSGNIR